MKNHVDAEQTWSVVQQIRSARGFFFETATIDLSLSQQETYCLNSLVVTNQLNQFDSYGARDSELELQLEEYFGGMGENELWNIRIVSQLISRLSSK